MKINKVYREVMNLDNSSIVLTVSACAGSKLNRFQYRLYILVNSNAFLKVIHHWLLGRIKCTYNTLENGIIAARLEGSYSATCLF